MKGMLSLLQYIVILNCLYVQAQSKYFSKSLQWNNNYVQEFRKAIIINDNYTVLIANIYPTFTGNWQNGIVFLSSDGDTSNINTFSNPNSGHIGAFDAIAEYNEVIVVGQLTPIWDSTTDQSYVQTINIDNNYVNITTLGQYPSAIQAIHKCLDGGYLLAGRIIPNYPNSPQWLEMYAVKLNSQLDIEWEHIYDDIGYFYNNFLTDILPASDGNGFYLLGTVNFSFNVSAQNTTGRIAIIHINELGEVLN